MKSKYSSEKKFQIVMESFTDNVTQAEYLDFMKRPP